jgi:60 kDa SS-A/Ro ribonucleoprotein
MESSQPHQGTYLGAALDTVNERYDRIIVITDEQSHDRVAAPSGKGYVINVVSARNGVGYGPWIHIDGFSEAVINYIRELENSEQR